MKEKVESIDYSKVEWKPLAASVLKVQWYPVTGYLPLEDNCSVEEKKSKKKPQAKGLLSVLSYMKWREPKLHVLKTNQGEKMILNLGFLNYSTSWQIEYQLPSEFPRLIPWYLLQSTVYFMVCFSSLPLKDEHCLQEDRQQEIITAWRDLQMAAMFYVLLWTSRRSTRRTWTWEKGVQHNSLSNISVLQLERLPSKACLRMNCSPRRETAGLRVGGICTPIHKVPKGRMKNTSDNSDALCICRNGFELLKFLPNQ